MIPEVVAVELAGPYRLRLRFSDGAEGELDVRAELPFDGVFEPLKDPEYFAEVRVDEELGTIVWPNGADLDPWVLHSRVTGIPIPHDDEEDDDFDWSTLSQRHVPQPPRGGRNVPEVSRFYGIVVKMYYDEHAPPHFHARYGKHVVVISVPNLGVRRGGLPPRALGLLMEWAAQHREELMEDWDLARAGKPLKRIRPLE